MLEGVADNEVVESMKGEFNKKCYQIMMKNDIYYGKCSINDGITSINDEETVQNYLNMFFDNDAKKSEKGLIERIIEVCNTYLDQWADDDYRYTSSDYKWVKVNYDISSHYMMVSICVKSEVLRDYYLIDVYSDSLLLGDTPDKGTVKIHYGDITKLSKPREESAITFEY